MPSTHSRAFVPRLLRYGLAAASLVAVAATAQPAGNPKGSVTPPSSDAQKAPATRPPAQANGPLDRGKLTAEDGPAKARTQTSRPPSAGTPGGLAPTRDSDPQRPDKQGRGDPQTRPVPK